MSKKGREYRKSKMICTWPVGGLQPYDQDARLAMKIILHPPSRIARDIDNYGKACIDFLEHNGVFPNDSQIDHLIITRGEIERPGAAIIKIWEHGKDEPF